MERGFNQVLSLKGEPLQRFLAALQGFFSYRKGFIMDRYPHLPQATNFPDVRNTAPYAQYHNDFDYSRWSAGARLTVCDVPWDDSRNVIGWETVEGRDAWFHDLETAERVTLTSEFQVLPDGSVKLPIPFATLSRANYIFVEYPTPTDGARPLDYADPAKEIRAWGYFIDDIRQLAASTSECHVRLDDWTTFAPYMRASYMQLSRGHAPMASTTVADYLADPANHSATLLTADVNYGGTAGITRDHMFVPFAAGEKYVMFATLVSPADLDGLRPATDWPGPSTPPTYSDDPARWGHQYNVDGYEWRMGARNYSQATTPVTSYTAGRTTPTAGYMYALPAADARRFFAHLAAYYPQMMQTIQAMWILPAELIDVAASGRHNIGGITVYDVSEAGELPDIQITLEPEMFGYPAEYSGIAKLYTYPYASLELSDNAGKTVEIRIENTGDLTLHRRTSLAYPYLKAQYFLTGVNGTGSKTYTFRKLDGTTATATSWDTDFAEYMTSFDIPTYSIFLDGYTAHSVHNQQANVEKARILALNAYHTGTRTNNTGYENGKDSANTAQTNGDASAYAGRQNALASNATAQTNANANADLAVTNTANTVSTTNDNLNKRTANRAADWSNKKGSAVELNNESTALSTRNLSADIAFMNTKFNVEAATGAISTAGSAASEFLSGDIGGGISAIVGGAVSIAKDGLILSATKTLNTTKQSNSTNFGNSTTAIQNNTSEALIKNANSFDRDVTKNNNALSTTNTANDAATAKNNAARTRNTGDSNANLSYNATVANNQRSNATTLRNLQESRDASTFALQTTLEQAQRSAALDYMNHLNDAPRAYGAPTGDATTDVFAYRGCQIRVKTQSESAIRQAGDQMLRYGYTYEGAWKPTTLNVMKHYTYWQCSELWLDSDTNILDSGRRHIRDLFETGVTVWRDPAEIGKVGIYDNWKD